MMSDPLKWTWLFGQHWNKTPEYRFQPGVVVAARSEAELQIHATLQDASIHLAEFPLNHPAFLECDAFEVFLGAPDVGHYYEFHITPSNSLLQLRFQRGADRSLLEDFMIWKPCFKSEVQIFKDSWNVYLQVHLESLGFSLSPALLISFGRYDHGFENNAPVISSTSPHSVCNFHRMEEWTEISAG